ncbi:uncharacterized protein LOC106170762 isoform X1 [Lingula anatina]|uniref:Uncharacterized protein LOC106170762 isoform X1 n=1 Tax=Lingula anatina TaxID=7574 RepID=A0A1S3J8L0_LINAN|nr:uncharacterized protein LOC106170762 isoform X1 [Lingula anatina]|eukprot:XP_013406204.1 uncharacterized protein LOC106170762 isoform X1 [Lingula anatina]
MPPQTLLLQDLVGKYLQCLLIASVYTHCVQANGKDGKGHMAKDNAFCCSGEETWCCPEHFYMHWWFWILAVLVSSFICCGTYLCVGFIRRCRDSRKLRRSIGTQIHYESFGAASGNWGSQTVFGTPTYSDVAREVRVKVPSSTGKASNSF